MRVVQTFWSGGKNPLENSYGWIHPEYNLMSWALSCMTLKEHYDEVALYTDSAGYAVLHDILGLLYTNKVKSKPEVFITSLIHQPHYDLDDSVSRIVWGNKDGGLNVTVVTNPYCGYCTLMHDRIEKLFEKTGDKISVRYVFSFDQHTEEGSKYLIAVYLDESLTIDRKKKIFDDWFRNPKKKNIDHIKKYIRDMDYEVVNIEMENHTQWCARTNNYATPTILVDGYKLPEDYAIEDIVWLLDIKK